MPRVASPWARLTSCPASREALSPSCWASTVLGAPEGDALVALAAAAIAFVFVIVVAGAAQRVEADDEASLVDAAPALPPS